MFILKSANYDIDDLAPCCKKVLEFLVETENPQSPSTILASVGYSKRSVQYALKDLSKRGLIERRASLQDMRQSIYILKAEIIRSRSYGLVEIILR